MLELNEPIWNVGTTSEERYRNEFSKDIYQEIRSLSERITDRALDIVDVGCSNGGAIIGLVKDLNRPVSVDLIDVEQYRLDWAMKSQVLSSCATPIIGSGWHIQETLEQAHKGNTSDSKDLIIVANSLPIALTSSGWWTKGEKMAHINKFFVQALQVIRPGGLLVIAHGRGNILFQCTDKEGTKSWELCQWVDRGSSPRDSKELALWYDASGADWFGNPI